MLPDTILQLQLRIQANPHAMVLEQYIAYLVSRGNVVYSVRQYVCVVEHFGWWLRRRPLNAASVRQFMHRHLPVCRCPIAVIRSVRCNRIALNHLLRMSGAVAAHGEFPRGFVGDLLRRYEERLVSAQGLAAGTVHRNLTTARTMLTHLRVRRAGQLLTWTPERIEGYVSSEARRYQPSTAHNIGCAIRSLLRFLLQEGLIRRDLATAVPTFAHWRLATLPETLREDEIARLINFPDAHTPIGLRDRAMLLCMSELGLRASEVAALELDGLDFTTNVLRLRRSKKRASTTLPMTHRLAEALKTYLQHGRPTCTTRVVFVLHQPPVGKPVSPGRVSHTVWSLARRSGFQGRISAHVLRHSVASRMLSAGASLKQIADLLGHESIDTTAIYAKVDLNALSQVALPWPGTKDAKP